VDQPSREDLIAALRAKFEQGGYDAIMPTLDDILTHGQIHAPEYIECEGCGMSFERVFQGTGSTKPVTRCVTCRADLRAEYVRTYHARRRESRESA
jgi:hypothetical protein